MIADILQSERAKKVEKIATKTHIKNPVWGYVWYLAGLPFILILATKLTWGDLSLSYKALPMMTMVATLYIGVWANKYQSAEHRSYRAIGLSVFYMSIGFLAIFAILALVRQYYSRSFLVFSYGLMVFWSTVGMLLFRKRHQSYVIIKGGLADYLRVFKKSNWKFVKELKSYGQIGNYDGIVVDLHAHNDKKLLKALADSSFHGTSVLHAATVLERYSGRTNLEYLAEEGLFNLDVSTNYRIFKRIWEVGLIILCSPIIISLMALTAIGIKIDSKGPVLFTQKRVGRDGELFTLYKFRSMYTDAEEDGSQFADKEDDRVTRVGRFIRKFRIDELPQFWNILKGDMSLIGPRPEQKEFVDYFDEEIPFYSYRHKVRPGITGWAQVKGGYAASLTATQKKLEYDLYYIKNMSLSLDLLIVYATMRTILTGFGSR